MLEARARLHPELALALKDEFRRRSLGANPSESDQIELLKLLLDPAHKELRGRQEQWPLKILVCSPSNSSADQYVLQLTSTLTSDKEMLRLFHNFKSLNVKHDFDEHELAHRVGVGQLALRVQQPQCVVISCTSGNLCFVDFDPLLKPAPEVKAAQKKKGKGPPRK